VVERSRSGLAGPAAVVVPGRTAGGSPVTGRSLGSCGGDGLDGDRRRGSVVGSFGGLAAAGQPERGRAGRVRRVGWCRQSPAVGGGPGRDRFDRRATPQGDGGAAFPSSLVRGCRLASIVLPAAGPATGLATVELFPFAIGFAVFRHRLHDIDRFLRRSLLWLALSAFVALLYLAVAVPAGFVAGRTSGVFGGVAVIIAVALVLEPVRARLQRGSTVWSTASGSAWSPTPTTIGARGHRWGGRADPGLRNTMALQEVDPLVVSPRLRCLPRSFGDA
jgi:hypothetical protein